MDRVDYDEYINRLKKRSSRFHIWRLSSARATSQWPRDAEEDIVLFLLDYAVAKALGDGSIEKVVRRYRMRWTGVDGPS